MDRDSMILKTATMIVNVMALELLHNNKSPRTDLLFTGRTDEIDTRMDAMGIL